MMFHTYTEGDPREFMYYKGEWYINGTEIILTDDYINKHTFNGLKLWKHARFNHKTMYNNQTAYFFCRSKYSYCDLLGMGYRDVKERNACLRDYAPYFVITSSELESAIESFSHPIKMSKEETEQRQKAIEYMIEHPKSDWDYPELRVLWVLYIAAMFGSLIFNQFYILWIVVSCIFFTYRGRIVNS